MDLSEKSSSEDRLSYHPWQQFDPFSIENPMNNSSPAASCQSVSMVDSYCSTLYSQQASPIGKTLPVGVFPMGSDSSKKRKRSGQDMELDQVQRVENSESKKRREQNSSKPAGKNGEDGADGAKDHDYIHVRARNGQATNSHSLAERVRRERISERMRFLQDLVPGCSKVKFRSCMIVLFFSSVEPDLYFFSGLKVTGKAVMLDEIINYVQSLQRQVEFLSMNLATVNPRLDANIEGLLSQDLLNLRSDSSSAIDFLPEMIYSQLHPPRQGLVQDALQRAINVQLTSLGGFKEPLSQMPNAWEDELHNIVQMNLGSDPPLNVQELNAKPRDGFPQ